MDNELFDCLLAGLEPKVCERVLLSSAKLLEEYFIAAKYIGVVFVEYSGATYHSSDDSTYSGHSKTYVPMEGIN